MFVGDDSKVYTLLEANINNILNFQKIEKSKVLN